MTLHAFVAPFALEATIRFVDAAARLEDVELVLITQQDAHELPPRTRDALAGHWRVDDALDPDALVAAVRAIGERAGRPVQRVIGVLEQLQIPLGQVRDRLGLPGMGEGTARNFREKHRMKDVLRAAGVPVARHRLVHGPEGAVGFAGEVGFPLVVKPPAGAGSLETFRLDGADALRGWLAATAPTPERPVLLEEFLVGDEHSYEAVVLGGRVVWHSISSYQPTPLEVLRNPWMQWVVLLPREIEGDEYAAIREVGPQALAALGMQDGLAHMEWFRRPDGSVAVSEVAARPPGAQLLSLISWAHDIDMFSAWPRLVLEDRFDPPQRRWAAGAAYLRGQHGPGGTDGGRIVAVHGVEELQRDIGQLVVEAKLPRPGQHPSGEYTGDGWVLLRHPETAGVAEALRRIITDLRVEIG
jgi:biotin carboxylase